MDASSVGAGGGSNGSNKSANSVSSTYGISSRNHQRQSKSCKRCLKRKKRCYGFPICTNCERANEPCEQSPFAVQLHQRDDNYAAMQRIKALEAQLESAHAELASLRQSQNQNQQQDTAFFPPSTDSSRRPSHTPTDGRLSRSQTMEPSPGPENTETTEPTETTKTTAELTPFPLLLEHIVQESVWRRLLPPTTDRGSNITHTAPAHGVGLPTDAAGLAMIQAYLDTVHTRYPILAPADLLQLHAQRQQTAGQAPSTVDRAIVVGEELDTFRLYIVYAIGATEQQRQQQYGGQQPGEQLPPEDYYEAALSHLWALQQLPPLASVEALVLLLLYGLQSPPVSSTAVWHAVGLAMRICIDLGLHREASYASSPDQEDQRDQKDQKDQQNQKRRLFWAVFCLDYSIALWLGRPPTLTRRDMDTQPPSPHDYSAGPAGGDAVDRQADCFAISARFVQLRQLEAHIYTDISALDEPLKARLGRVRSHLDALDAWAHGLQQSATAIAITSKTERANDDLFLLWNKAVLALLRPFLLVMRPEADSDDDLLVTRCLQAAGHVCSAAKRMQQQQQRGLHAHALAATQSAFNAGITICCCLYLSPRLWSFAAVDHLRACSSTMLAMAERLPHLKKDCSVLEDAIGGVMDSLARTASAAPGGPGSESGADSRRGPDRPARTRQARLLAEPDILAVQSLMELSAQQDLAAAASTAALAQVRGGVISAEQAWNSAGPLDSALSALQLRSRRDENENSLRRLVGLIAPEHPTC